MDAVSGASSGFNSLRHAALLATPRYLRAGICTLHGWSFALILALDSAPCLYTRRRELVLAAQLFYIVRVP